MKLLRTKTFWTGAAALAAAAGAYLAGEAGLVQALQMAITGLAAIFLRHGMVKQVREPKVDERG
ncbi:hypothetical protein AAU61_00730 [Desulfocarbo indianensis]|nr:hypothetical protein AAU61_00730 [Desulfocarbo indianensis]